MLCELKHVKDKAWHAESALNLFWGKDLKPSLVCCGDQSFQLPPSQRGGGISYKAGIESTLERAESPEGRN